MANTDEKEALSEKKTQALVSLSVGFIFIFIGLPLWWNTTKVYRAPLPYSEIEELNQLKVSYLTRINVILLGDQNTDVLKEEIEKELNKGKESSTIVAEYEVVVQQKETHDVALLEKLKTSSLEDLDEYFWDKFVTNKDSQLYSFIVLPHSRPDSSSHDIFLGKYSHCIMYNDKDLRKLALTITSVLKNIYVNEKAVNRAFSLASKRQFTEHTVESMRAQKSITGFQVSFTLLNSDPQSVLAEWDVEAATQKYLDPFLQKFPHLDISVDSQVLHYSSIRIAPKKSEESFYLPYDDLPHMINPIEAKLGSHISLFPSLNFIVYIPGQEHTPLYMRTKDGETSSTNAFMSPHWGGIMIYNIQRSSAENSTTPQRTAVDMKSVMSVFLSQLKLLLGVLPVEPQDGLLLRHGRDVQVTRWEQDMLMRLKTMEYLATSCITLTSLAQLLGEISNMVINDNIQQQVEQALIAIHQSTAALQQGNLSTAVLTAKKAIRSSEEAFFDPSILELLYFPDDQKYAIYIPLFLPIGVPVLLSIRQAIRWLRGRDGVEETEEQKHKKE